jgi:hypothetical protein
MYRTKGEQYPTSVRNVTDSSLNSIIDNRPTANIRCVNPELVTEALSSQVIIQIEESHAWLDLCEFTLPIHLQDVLCQGKRSLALAALRHRTRTMNDSIDQTPEDSKLLRTFFQW